MSPTNPTNVNTSTLTVSVPSGFLHALRDYARAHNRSVSSLILEYVAPSIQFDISTLPYKPIPHYRRAKPDQLARKREREATYRARAPQTQVAQALRNPTHAALIDTIIGPPLP